MCNIKNQEAIQIDVEVTDLVLTARTCAVLINEIIKCLVYQKSQIPYPYVWLKSVVNRKRKSADSDEDKINNFSVERHYRVVSSAFDTMEEIMKNIQSEFEGRCNAIREILIVFGTTPQSPKEVFTVRVPKVITRHVESPDIVHKHRHKILRKLFLSQDWLKAMDHDFSSTNMYIMLKKQIDPNISNDFFIPIEDYIPPNKSRNVIINLYYGERTDYFYCDNVVFEGDASGGCSPQCKSDSSALEYRWFQANSLLKGYKDYFVNKISATELF